MRECLEKNVNGRFNGKGMSITRLKKTHINTVTEASMGKFFNLRDPLTATR